MVFVPIRCFGSTILGIVCHGTDEFDFVGQACCCKTVPDYGSPAGDFCDAVPKWHCYIVRRSQVILFQRVTLLIFNLAARAEPINMVAARIA